MIVVPAGDFLMGSPEDEPGRYDDESPQRGMTLHGFAVSKHEITFDQWFACVSAGGCTGNPVPDDQGWGRGDRPVINVTWHDARQYVDWLSWRTGQAYRLLSEAEWEYAARAGTTGRYAWGDEDPTCEAGPRNAVRFQRCGDDRSRPVGTHAHPNSFGLYDMHGSVWEWVQDCYTRTATSTDGTAFETDSCDLRAARGGSWDVDPRDLRSANRFRIPPDFYSKFLGFRVARSLTSTPLRVAPGRP